MYSRFVTAIRRIPRCVLQPAQLLPVIGVLASMAGADPCLAQCMDYGAYMHPVGRAGSQYELQAVATAGSLAYLANTSLQVFDCRDAYAPKYVGQYWSPDRAHDVVIAGGFVYGALEDAGLVIFEEGLPVDPMPVGSLELAGPAVNVSVSGELAVVSCWLDGIRVVDVSDPAHPSLLGSLDTPGAASVSEIVGSLVYVVDSRALLVIDISDPAHPGIVASLGVNEGASGLAVAGSHAFISGTLDGIQVVDITIPSMPRIVGAIPGLHPHRMAIRDGTLFCADPELDLFAVDVSDPCAPVVIGSAATGSAWDVAVSGDLAYVVGGMTCLQVVDLTHLRSPDVPPAQPTVGPTCRIAIQGDIACIADGQPGLEILDVSDPQAPRWLAVMPLAGQTAGIAIAGNHAYVTNWNRGLQVIDIEDHRAPRLVGEFPIRSVVGGVCVANARAYVAAGLQGVYVIDVADPVNPVLVTVVDTPSSALDVVTDGAHVFVADTNPELCVVDVSDPSGPHVVGSLNTSGEGYGVELRGTTVFLAANFGGLQLVDVSEPTAPRLAGRAGTVLGRDVAVEGDFAYVAGGGSGLQVIDVADIESPRIVGSVDVPGYASFVTLAGGHVLVSCGGDGLCVLPLQCGRAAAVDGPTGIDGRAVITAWPNPASDGVTVGVSPDKSGPVRLEVYDIAGRLVRTLVGAGGSLRWDGCGDDGRPLPAGTYFVGAADRGDIAPARVTLVR